MNPTTTNYESMSSKELQDAIKNVSEQAWRKRQEKKREKSKKISDKSSPVPKGD